MYRSVLVPLDGSPQSEWALPAAAAIAREHGATLRLATVHAPVVAPIYAGAVYEQPWRTSDEDPSLHYLHQMAHRIGTVAGTEPTATVLFGPVDDALITYAENHQVDLIVMTTHGHGPLVRLWLGSTADGIIRHSPVPVLLVRPPYGESAESAEAPVFRNVLIPLDGSEQSEAVIPHAIALTSPSGAEFTLLHVRLSMLPGFLPDSALGYEAVLDAGPVEASVERQLERVTEELRGKGLRAQTAIAAGASVALAIRDYATHNLVDLIALTTHGRGGVRRLLLGSVADKLVRAAHEPVLVFRPPTHGAAPA